jgi:hypothetical protein
VAKFTDRVSTGEQRLQSVASFRLLDRSGDALRVADVHAGKETVRSDLPEKQSLTAVRQASQPGMVLLGIIFHVN